MNSRTLKNIAIEILQKKKAENIKFIDCTKLDYHLADFIIFANGRSNKNVAAIGDAVADEYKQKGVLRVSLEGFEKSEWILVDIGQVLVNIFHPEARERYQLESLWDSQLIQDVSED